MALAETMRRCCVPVQVQELFAQIVPPGKNAISVQDFKEKAAVLGLQPNVG